jgi:WD repeat-containing protein 35
LAEYSINKLNLKVAEHAFVRCKDYAGIQLVKRLGNMQNDTLKHAEVAAHFGRYDDAERLYIDLDRKDLAVALRKKLGDWFRVLELLQTGSFADDQQLEEAYNAIGDFYADRQKWQLAVQHYVKGRNQERLAKCYYLLEDHAGLKTLTDQLPENHKLLQEIAEMFITLGMCREAVDAYVKCNKVQQALDACVQLNQWDIAIELTRTHMVRDTEPLLVKYAETLLDKNKTFDAIELYRKANHFVDAAKLVYQVAEQEAKRCTNPLRVKKLFLLAALLIEQYHEQMKSTHRAKTKKRGPEAVSSLAGLLAEDVAAILDTKVIDNAWRSAEAYNFYILAQRQLYDGLLDNAMKTCQHLRDYDDIIDPVIIYSLLGLTSSAVRAFGTCSKAFSELEALDSLTPEQRQQFEELAMQIFLKYGSKDAKVNQVECPSCAARIPDTSTICTGCDTKFPACIVTGRSLFVTQHWMCPSCKHHAYPQEIASRRTCPLCHAHIV